MRAIHRIIFPVGNPFDNDGTPSTLTISDEDLREDLSSCASLGRCKSREQAAHKLFTHSHFLPPFDPGFVPGTNAVCPWGKLGFHCVKQGENLGLSQGQTQVCPKEIPGVVPRATRPQKNIFMCLFFWKRTPKTQRTSKYENGPSRFVRSTCAISLGLYPFERYSGTTLGCLHLDVTVGSQKHAHASRELLRWAKSPIANR